jgi:hypothetical protein
MLLQSIHFKRLISATTIDNDDVCDLINLERGHSRKQTLDSLAFVDNRNHDAPGMPTTEPKGGVKGWNLPGSTDFW